VRAQYIVHPEFGRTREYSDKDSKGEYRSKKGSCRKDQFHLANDFDDAAAVRHA
jgi:hypothetical protein